MQASVQFPTSSNAVEIKLIDSAFPKTLSQKV